MTFSVIHELCGAVDNGNEEYADFLVKLAEDKVGAE